jgi:glycine/D-amino acid oxidase-like deaminating enzyme
MHRQLGIDSRLLSPGELKELVPQINPEGLELAAYEPGSGFADPVATAQSFAKAAQQMGCTLMEGCEVKSARFSNNRVERLETSRGFCQRTLWSTLPAYGVTGFWICWVLSSQ